VQTFSPASAQEAAEALRVAAQTGERVEIRGGGTKRGWGGATPQAELELSSECLGGIAEHNASDLTAVLGAGQSLAGAQEAFGQAGQMLALDPPDPGGRATVGGVFACADAGPLRHRYGAARDLLLGIQLALPDGSVARAGSRVIKNVAGYDLAKLSVGALGTLGLIVELVVRLHPRAERTVTAIGSADDPGALAAARDGVARAPLELESFDLTWAHGQGALLARAGGPAAESQAHRVRELMSCAGLDVRLEEEDEELWEAQRARQRSVEGVVVKVSALPGDLARVVACAESLSARVVGRAGRGIHWIGLPAAADADLVTAVGELRARLAPSPCVVQDAPAGVRSAIDPWGVPEGPELALMRRVKARFDPRATCNPGRYVGGI